MFWIVAVVLLAFVFPVDSRAEDCAAIAKELKLPVNLKTRGKPKVGKWEKVDEILNRVAKNPSARACRFAFRDLFRNKKEAELHFPLTRSVLKEVPEDVLRGVAVYTKEGDLLGRYENRVRYEKSGGLQVLDSYESYYFQFSTPAGKLESVGNRLLLDSYVVKWTDIKDKVAVTSQ
jgi:hypothetical protein